MQFQQVERGYYFVERDGTKEDHAKCEDLNILVDALCKEGMLIEAKFLFDKMIQRGIEPDIVSYNSLIDGYCL